MSVSHKNLIQMPEVTGINRLPPRATLLPFPDAQSAKTRRRENTPWFQSLNGEWNFQWDGSSELRTIPVPSSWTLQNSGDWPIYTNIKMPFDCPPPRVPEENPAAIYQTSFVLDAAWFARRTVIHFGGVESAFFLFCNGAEVGMSKGSRTPAEFDLTPFVREGENKIEVRVFRWSDGSFLEDQDHWWMAGIYREVYLYSTAREYIQDVFARPVLNDDFLDAALNVDVCVGSSFSQKQGDQFQVGLSLFDPDGNEVALENACRTTLLRPVRMTEWGRSELDHNLRFRFEISRPKHWNAETPNLYTLVVELKTLDGTSIEATSARIGFRRYEVKGRDLLINGKRVQINGVNRHDHDQLHGKTVSRETMLKDIRLLKQFNFNAVRTAHYPNDPAWYELCDEYGLYVMDEANVECHDYYDQLCRDPRWTAAFLDRVQRMVHRDKNHACIFCWSLGNESGYGPNHDACAGWVRRFDPTRLVHYEGITRMEFGQAEVWFTPNRGLIASDLFSPMYPQVEDIIRFVREVGDSRPYITCEYSHAMGNSNGSLHEYFELFANEPGVQGGFIWDWVDQGLLLHREKRMRGAGWELPEDEAAASAACHQPGGKWFWGYGGDFGEERHDVNFCLNGLNFPDRTPKPAMFEFKKLAQPVGVEWLGNGKVRITNKRYFTDLSDLAARWELLADGGVFESGELPALDVAPGESSVFQCLENGESFVPTIGKKTIHLDLSFQTLEKTAWCDAGYEVAREQIEIQAGEQLLSKSRPLSVSVEDGRVSIRCDGSVVLSELDLNLWRACTDNDGVRGWTGQENKPMGQWQSAGFDRLQIETCKVTEERDTTVVSRTYGQGIELTQTFTPCEEGLRVKNEFVFPESLPSLPRIGLKAVLPAGFEQLEWFGRGPHESYCDRKAGAFSRRWHSTVSEQYVAYVPPQEHGNHVDTRWLELGRDSSVVRIAAEREFEFSASHFTADDLFCARHTDELTPRPETFVTIDLKQRGLGTGTCGPQTRPEYCVGPGVYAFDFTISMRSDDE